MHRKITVPHLLGLILLICLVLFSLLYPLFLQTDVDFWWHLAIGNHILSTHTIPSHDIYSYTVQNGVIWIDHEWLSEVIIALLMRVGGYPLIGIAFGIIGLICLLLELRILYRITYSFFLSVVLLYGFVILSLPIYGVRIQLLSFFFFILLTELIRKQSHPFVYYVVIPLFFILWANLHGGWLIGFGYYILTQLIKDWIYYDKQDWKNWKNRIVIQVLHFISILLLISVLTPFHIYTVLYPLSYLSNTNNSLRFITEWQTPNIKDSIYAPFTIILFLYFALYYWASKKILDLFQLLQLFLFLGMTFFAQRNITFLTILLIPQLSQLLPVSKLQILSHKSFLFSLSLAVVLFALFTWYIALSSEFATNLQIHEFANDSGYPTGATKFLKTHHYSGNLFSVYAYNNYFIQALWPHYTVFIDGRADLYSFQVFSDYNELIQPSPHFAKLIRAYRIALIVLPTNSKEKEFLQKQKWDPIYQDSTSTIYHNENN